MPRRWDVEPSQGTNTWLLPIPATFVVGTDGEVKARFVDPDYRKRMTIEKTCSRRSEPRIKQQRILDQS